jgi:hypothetical protein
MDSNGFSTQAPPGAGGISRRAVLGNLAGGSALLATIMGLGRAQAQMTPAPGEVSQAPNHFVLAGAETRSARRRARSGDWSPGTSGRSPIRANSG